MEILFAFTSFISSWIFENFTAKIDLFRQAGILVLFSKVDKYKTKSAAILLNFSPPLLFFFHPLGVFLSLPDARNVPFWPFSVKWLQVLVLYAFKIWLDIHIWHFVY